MKKKISGAKLDEIDERIIALLNEHEKLSKVEAPEHGIKESTFQVHAKKLTKLGILVEESVKVVDGKGRPRVLYSIKENDVNE